MILKSHVSFIRMNPNMNPNMNTKATDFSLISDQDLLLRMRRLVQSERKIMHLVLVHIREVEKRKLYLQEGVTSLYQYLTQILGYAENAAYDRIQGSRILTEGIADQVERGSLKLSQLVRVSSCLKQSKKEGKIVSDETTLNIFKRIENKTIYETDQILAEEFEMTPQHETKIKPQKDGSVQVQITLNSEEYSLFKKVQKLISHSVPDQSVAESVVYLAQFYLQKKEGRHFFKQQSDSNVSAPESQQKQTKEIKKSNTVSHQVRSLKSELTQSFGKKPFLLSSRKYISIQAKRSLLRRAEYRCEYIYPSSNQRCDSCYQLQVDHLVPLALGGKDDIENLRILCGVHNRSEAEKLGLRKMIRKNDCISPFKSKNRE